MRLKNLIIILLMVSNIQCSKKLQVKKELLFCEANYNNVEQLKYSFRCFSDSTYIFTIDHIQLDHEKHEKFSGRCYFKNDTLTFCPFDFEFIKTNSAVLKYNYLEFINGRYPFKMKVVKSEIKQKLSIDTLKFSDYALFTYDTSFYNCFSGNVTSYDLNDKELNRVDSILYKCITDNLRRTPDRYYRQCLAIKNPSNERIVYIKCFCKEHSFSSSYKLGIIDVHDGGDCFFVVKINLDRNSYFDLSINGLG